MLNSVQQPNLTGYHLMGTIVNVVPENIHTFPTSQRGDGGGSELSLSFDVKHNWGTGTCILILLPPVGGVWILFF